MGGTPCSSDDRFRQVQQEKLDVADHGPVVPAAVAGDLVP